MRVKIIICISMLAIASGKDTKMEKKLLIVIPATISADEAARISGMLPECRPAFSGGAYYLATPIKSIKAEIKELYHTFDECGISYKTA